MGHPSQRIGEVPIADRNGFLTQSSFERAFWCGAGTLVGASAGWVHHGWPGAIVSGIIGFGFGAFIASSPLLALTLLS
jgi:hypothetical protein